MQNARVTVLMEPSSKAALDASASKMGVSSGEYIRLAVDNFATVADREVLDAMTAELADAVPAMHAALSSSIKRLEQANARVDAYFAERRA